MKKLEILVMGIPVDACSLLSLIKFEISNSRVNVNIIRTIGDQCGVSITKSDISVKLGDRGQVKVIINFIIYILRGPIRQINVSRIES